MKEKIGTIFGIIIFTVTISVIVYVNLKSHKEQVEIYSEIKIDGNHLLSVKDYLISSDLNKMAEYPELSIQEIKSRIVQHPYVAKAEVQSDGNGIVDIKIIEKNFMAVLLTKKKPYLVSEDFRITNLNMNSNISSLPIISNIDLNEKNDQQNRLHSEELIRAFKIIDAVKMVNDEMHKDLAEINLRYGGDVILSFSGFNNQIIFGKGSEGKKIVILSSIWEGLTKGDKLFKNSGYVDLRFNNEIFIGKPVNTETNG